MRRNEVQYVNINGTMVPVVNGVAQVGGIGVPAAAPFDPAPVAGGMQMAYIPQGGFAPQVPFAMAPGTFMPAPQTPVLNSAPSVRVEAAAEDPLGGQDPFWYKKHAEMLAAVTNENANPAVGVTKIEVYQPNQNQYNAGIVCKVNVETIIGTFKNISIMTSKFADGAIRLVVPSHESQSGNGKYYTDYSLTEPVTAQVLSYIDSRLVKNAPAQA